MKSIDLKQKLQLFNEHWQPKTVCEFNGHDVMVAKVKGEFRWHHHDDTDDFFYLIEGTLDIELKINGTVETVHLKPGDLYVVPQGIEHRPIAREEAHIMLIERSGTPNSGDITTAAPRTFL
jgi:mannose-6-phosphate isomerase-like protein (cupin superfamily)